jgi:hypothetical protein
VVIPENGDAKAYCHADGLQGEVGASDIVQPPTQSITNIHKQDVDNEII